MEHRLEIELDPALIVDDVKRAATLLAEGRVVAFTGAGISAESGVPTYRDQGGLWTTYDMQKVSHIRNFLEDPVSCWRFELELFRLLRSATPNAAHGALAELEACGILTGVVTQNVDGLHNTAGSRNVVELHGNESRARCMSCGTTCPCTAAFQSVGWVDEDGEICESCLPDITPLLRASSSVPHHRSRNTSSCCRPKRAWPLLSVLMRRKPVCPEGAPRCKCGGLLKPDAIYFGERLDRSTLKQAVSWFRSCDVALIIGSSCSVTPASELPKLLKARGGTIIELNPKISRVSPIADVHLHSSAGEMMPRLVTLIKAHRGQMTEVEQARMTEDEPVRCRRWWRWIEFVS